MPAKLKVYYLHNIDGRRYGKIDVWVYDGHPAYAPKPHYE